MSIDRRSFATIYCTRADISRLRQALSRCFSRGPDQLLYGIGMPSYDRHGYLPAQASLMIGNTRSVSFSHPECPTDLLCAYFLRYE